MRTIPVLLMMLLFVAPAWSADDAGKKDLKAIAGKWTVEKLEFNNENLTEQIQLQLVFQGTTLTLSGNDEVKNSYGKFRVHLDATTMPKIADLTVTAGDEKGVKMEGIYKLEGDKLTLCINVFNQSRPAEFKSPADSSIALVVLKRMK